MAKVRKAKLTDAQIETLINLWHDEPSLWNSSLSTYSNADVRKAALTRISQQLDGPDVGAYELLSLAALIIRDALVDWYHVSCWTVSSWTARSWDRVRVRRRIGLG